MRIVGLAQWTLAAGVIAGTLLQFVGALYVRQYARGLWVRECREEETVLRAERLSLVLDERRSLESFGGRMLPVIDEEDELGIEKL